MKQRNIILGGVMSFVLLLANCAYAQVGDGGDVHIEMTSLWDFYLPSRIVAGRSASVEVEAWTEDSGNITSNLKFYLSKDSTLNVSSDKLIGELQINLVGPQSSDERQTFTGSIRIPPKTKAGNYVFFLTIDGREVTSRGDYFSQALKITRKKK